MQHLTTAELENELAIRKATAAFEAALRKGEHACIDVLFYLERDAGYTPEQSVKTLLHYADAHGWNTGPYSNEEEEFFAAEESAIEAQRLTASERANRIEKLKEGLEAKVQVYYDGEIYHKYTGKGLGQETWTQEQWDEYAQNLHH